MALVPHDRIINGGTTLVWEDLDPASNTWEVGISRLSKVICWHSKAGTMTGSLIVRFRPDVTAGDFCLVPMQASGVNAGTGMTDAELGASGALSPGAVQYGDIILPPGLLRFDGGGVAVATFNVFTVTLIPVI